MIWLELLCTVVLLIVVITTLILRSKRHSRSKAMSTNGMSSMTSGSEISIPQKSPQNVTVAKRLLISLIPSGKTTTATNRSF